MISSEIIAKVANDLGLPKELVEKTYSAYWKVIKDYIISLPLKKDLSEKEFKKLRPNINIPSIGKLYITYDRYKRLKRRDEVINNIKIQKDVAH